MQDNQRTYAFVTQHGAPQKGDCIQIEIGIGIDFDYQRDKPRPGL